MKLGRGLRIFNVVVVSYILLLLLVVGVGQQNYETNAATVKLNDWTLYSRRSNSVVYCNDRSSYWDRFKRGVKVWNNCRKGVLKQWKKGDIVTCRVQDITEISTIYGRTYSKGFIVFNTNQMRKLEDKEKTNVVLHEIGHALGLGHNGYWDVMNPSAHPIVKLTENDKESLKRAFEKFCAGR